MQLLSPNIAMQRARTLHAEGEDADKLKEIANSPGSLQVCAEAGSLAVACRLHLPDAVR